MDLSKNEKTEEKDLAEQNQNLKLSFLKRIDLWLGKKIWAKINFISKLTSKNRVKFFIILFLVIISGMASLDYGWIAISDIGPAHGGTYTEAIVGRPQFINPIWATSNMTDQDLVALVFAPLFKIDDSGKLSPNLAKKYTRSENGKIYTIYLRDNVLWQDKEKFTADDVIFTIQTIQNPEIKSSLEPTWRNIIAEKIDDYTLRLILPNPYAQFINNLTLSPLPKHIWTSIPSQEFFSNQANKKPIGNGPFIFDSFTEDTSGHINSYTLKSNSRYFLGKPFLDKITLKFFDSESEALNSLKLGLTDGTISFTSEKPYVSSQTKIHKINIPECFTIFFNSEKNPILQDLAVRKAFEKSIDKQTLLNNYFNGNGIILSSPFMPFMNLNIETPSSTSYDVSAAKQILEKDGWKLSSGTYQKKLNGSTSTQLELTLTTTNWPVLKNIANSLTEQLALAGIKLNTKIIDGASLQQDIISQHNYEMLLVGEILSLNPDPFLFWHSSSIKTGLNLSSWSNADANKLLEKARSEFDDLARAKLYSQFAQDLEKDKPAIFLFSPQLIYAINKPINNINVTTINIISERFTNVNNWYINTTRKLKISKLWK
jgi:peptide/nickel transport system substrate-binding protein